MTFPRNYREMLANKRVVTIGGGTGPFAVLSSLKHTSCQISAIVSMADSGGSSRRLMDEFGQLPFGDLRQALVALSRNGVLWRDIFTFRYKQDQELFTPAMNSVAGHNLGNLIISALQFMNDGDLLSAIQDAQELLDTAGDVFPVTVDQTTLCAELEDGSIIEGETNIDRRADGANKPLSPIKRIFLKESSRSLNQSLRAIRRADIIIIGPGDLYTSILPNLLVDGVAAAIRESESEKVYVCNLMTKHGETDGFKASGFVQVLHKYLGGRVDRVILHDGRFSPELLAAYGSKNQYPVIPDIDHLESLVPELTVDRLIAPSAPDIDYVRHDPELLIRAILAPYMSK